MTLPYFDLALGGKVYRPHLGKLYCTCYVLRRYCGLSNVRVPHFGHIYNGLKCTCYLRAQTCHPATSCIRDQDATTAPATHMWERGSLNWVQFMLQWLIRFLEFAEFSEFLSFIDLLDQESVIRYGPEPCTLYSHHPVPLTSCILYTLHSFTYWKIIGYSPYPISNSQFH